MSKHRRLFIHIGHYKTGTTAIQRFLSDESDALLKCGILYPAHSRPEGDQTNHGLLPMSIASQYGKRPPNWYRDQSTADDAFDRFNREVNSSDAEVALISSELFVDLALIDQSAPALDQLGERLSDYDVRIIFYIREPLALAKSWFNQINQGRRPTANFPTYFVQRPVGFLSQIKIYEAFASRFGPENVIVKTYRHVGAAHLADFVAILDCDIAIPEDPELLQRAQSEDFLELIRLAKDRGRRSYADVTLTDVKDPRLLLDRVAKINAGYERVAAYTDVVAPSKLSASALFDHYASLLRPLRQFKAFKFNQDEADNLQRLALDAEQLDVDLARSMYLTARVIRPSDKSIKEALDRLDAAAT